MIVSLRLALAFSGVALTLVGNLTRFQTDELTLLVFAALVVLSFKALNRLARGLAGLCVIALAITFISGDFADLTLGSAIFIFAFLLTSGTLRVMASEDPAVRRLGETILSGRVGNQFLVISLGTGLLASAFLNGAVQFVSGIFASRADAAIDERLAITRSILSGFALNPILSPIAIPFVVISSTMPIVQWGSVAPYLFAAGLMVWCIGALEYRRITQGAEMRTLSDEIVSTADGDPASPTQRGINLTGLGLVVAPIALTIALYVALEIRLTLAAFVSILTCSLIWPLVRLRRPNLIAKGYASAINEATVIGSSILLGLMIVSIIPDGLSYLAADGLTATGVLAPSLVFFSFVLGGILGLQPAICYLASFSVIQTYLLTNETLSVPIMAAMIVGWSLNSVCGPVGMPLTIVARAFNLSPFTLALSRGWQHLIAILIGCMLVLLVGPAMSV